MVKVVTHDRGDPVLRYLGDARAVGKDDGLDESIRVKVVCTLVHDAIECAAHEVVWQRAAQSGIPIAATEEDLGEVEGLRQALALALLGDRSLLGCWQRACACLLRAALEQALAEYWEHKGRRASTVCGRPMRNQLLILNVLGGEAIAGPANQAWHGLSRAMHHHTYELPPTVSELQGWHQNVTDLIERLG